MLGSKAAFPTSRGVMSKKSILQTVVACVVLALRLPSSHGQPQGSIVGWGDHLVGVNLNQGFIAVAAGANYNLGLKADGSIVPWGDNE